MLRTNVRGSPTCRFHRLDHNDQDHLASSFGIQKKFPNVRHDVFFGSDINYDAYALLSDVVRTVCHLNQPKR